MIFSSGTRLGPYEVFAPIGKGGMGEVWKARDTKLGRDVALKILPTAFASDPDRMARFEREARVLASLDHPNIAAIYGQEESNGVRALVLALIDGPTLADRIAAGPIPLDEAIQIARQIAEAVEYAHERGVIHRDLKPANIKITSGGMVKVLDFGLAKALDDEPVAGSGTNSPTLTMNATRAGMLLGTAAYMSPEQVKGKQADRRSDIWSFGAVLYEMLTGKPPFSGESVGEVIAVIKDETKLDAVPAELSGLVARCLNKDPRQRLQAIGEARIALENPDLGEPGPATAPAPQRSWRGWLWPSVAALVTVALAALAFVHFRERPLEQPRVQFGIPLPGKATNAMFEISPDGRYLAIVSIEGSRSQLWIRPLDSGEARVLPGTEGATYPFFSPDSAYLGFFADGKLKKIAVGGGFPQTLCEGVEADGGAWNQRGVILFGGRGLKRVSSAGGVPVDVTKAAASGEHHNDPLFLPGGRRFLFTNNGVKPETNGVYAGSLDGPPPVRLLPDLSSVAYVPGTASERNGYLLFRRGTTLMAQPFDPVQAKLSGEIFPVAEQVDSNGHVGHGAFSVSQKGGLVYRSAGGDADIRELVWMDRTGKRLGVLGKPGMMGSLALSPDEKQVALGIADRQAGTSDIWILDIARGATSRFTFGPGLIQGPVWSPDGASIAFASRGTSILRDLYRKPVNGAGEQELLVRAAGLNARPYDWSRDGKFLVYGREGETKRNLWLVGLDGDRKPAPYVEAPYNETMAQFSPDGKWMAYVSDESGQNQVYVRAIPPTRPPVQVSIAGGSAPTWRRDARELFYISADQKVTAVPIKIGTTFEASTPQPLFDLVPQGAAIALLYQPSADGKRFLMLAPPADKAAAPITVVLNWQAGLKR